ncbi:hypothetical protein E2C01_094062 [Portunus trituberculatus]|uniref:Uncharacterized protein n=1 Tax=Portunus trituberculatus TaxID=210409 RepID=A0A5B7JRI1_PORTR|nr:hypothetical protein [Portunus trituberculatus]
MLLEWRRVIEGICSIDTMKSLYAVTHKSLFIPTNLCYKQLKIISVFTLDGC